MQQIFSQEEPEYPPVSEALLRHLENTFPMAGYRNIPGERDLHRYHGVQEVIDHLRTIQNANEGSS